MVKDINFASLNKSYVLNMKNKIIILSFLFLVLFSPSSPAADINKVILIDDFDNMVTSNLLGGKTQGDEESEGGCIPTFTEEGAYIFGLSGHSLQLDFDVTFPGTFSFYTTQLGPPGVDAFTSRTLDLSDYNYLSFWYKTDMKRINFSVEIHRDGDGNGQFILGKDSSSKIIAAKYTKGNLPGIWHKVAIPLKNFTAISSWNNIVEIVFVFEDVLHSGKGTLYLDDILFGSNYPLSAEDEKVPFPGRLLADLFMVNGQKVDSRFLVNKVNTFDLLLKNIHPHLEVVSIEASEYGNQEWFTICKFFDHRTGLYKANWAIEGTKKKFYFLRVVAMDIFGREKVLAGPYGGSFVPEGLAEE